MRIVCYAPCQCACAVAVSTNRNLANVSAARNGWIHTQALGDRGERSNDTAKKKKEYLKHGCDPTNDASRDMERKRDPDVHRE